MTPSRKSLDFIRHAGKTQFLHGGLYAGAHKVVKSVYAKDSQRQTSAMDGSVSRYNMKLQNDYLSCRKEVQRTRENHGKVYTTSQRVG